MTLSNTIHKNKFEMDERPKCKAGHYKSLRGKHKQNTCIHAKSCLTLCDLWTAAHQAPLFMGLSR